MKSFIAIFFVILSLFVQTGEAFAYQVPNFTSCVNPQGEVKVNYETGTHGIVGNTGSFQGKDTVYTLSGDALTQCFCAVDGKGVQTNWWKASSLTEQEIGTLKSLGWNYVPNGALWGLENAPYLALNSDFSCKSSSGGSGGNGDTSSSSNNSGSGSVSGTAANGVGQVLGLASTGNTKFLLSVLLVSVFALVLGIVLKVRANNSSK